MSILVRIIHKIEIFHRTLFRRMFVVTKHYFSCSFNIMLRNSRFINEAFYIYTFIRQSDYSCWQSWPINQNPNPFWIFKKQLFTLIIYHSQSLSSINIMLGVCPQHFLPTNLLVVAVFVGSIIQGLSLVLAAVISL